MDIASILTPKCVLHKLSCSSKKRLFENIASHLCEQYPHLDLSNVFNALLAREKLGSTGIGQGIAIPHCRIASSDSIIGVLATLDSPIDFDAIDNEPVDIIFVLLVPEDSNEDHLRTLASLAEVFSNSLVQQRIREANNSTELHGIIAN